MFEEYAESLDFELDFQEFDIELKEIHTIYAPPAGCLLLARENEKAIGCVALRKIDKKICEMKRLYVNPNHRGKDISRMLAEQIIQEAKQIGYFRMRLDTVPSMKIARSLPSMKIARSLYRSLGFTEIEPYRFNPIGGTSFMELKIAMINEQ